MPSSNHVHEDLITKLVNEDHKIHDSDNIHAAADITEPSKEVLGPSTNISESAMLGSSDRKPTIGIRKVQPKRPGAVSKIFSTPLIVSRIAIIVYIVYGVKLRFWRKLKQARHLKELG